MSENSAPTIQTAGTKRQARIGKAFVDTVCTRLAAGQRVRRSLPDWGRVHIDRQLPFLSIYRLPKDIEDPGMDQFVIGEASYIVASGEPQHQQGLARLIHAVASTLQQAFGSVLILEIWSSRELPAPGTPSFRLVAPKSHTLGATLSAFEQALIDARIGDASYSNDANESSDSNGSNDVAIVELARVAPPGLPPLLPAKVMAQEGLHMLGLEVQPTFRNLETGGLFPLVQRQMRRRIAHATKEGFFDFISRHTTHRPPHFLSLGPRAMVKAVWAADEQLAQISNTYDLLLSVTPINTDEAWQAFRKAKFEHIPEFRYRPLPIDPALLKRKLYKVPLEKIEDPTLANLFYTQQLEQDRKISLLSDRGTPNFVFGCLQLYGRIDDDLVATAGKILDSLPPRRKRDDAGSVNAEMFANYATEELNHLRRTFPDIKSKAIVRRDIAGLMVSRGNLLIGASTSIAPERVPASLAHEVGTHIITYINARMQPFKQLYVGLPGYDEFQEGLACLSEYLAGGLDPTRMRLLAARVIAARAMVEGASFIDVYRELTDIYRFKQRSAFMTTMRVFRGGGFSKDAVYLRGLIRVLQHLGDGGHFEPLLVGKFNLEHVPIIEELQLRRVLSPPALRPSYLDDPNARERLDQVRAGLTVLDLARTLAK